MNKLFVGYKPPYITSNRFLTGFKKKFNDKNCGYSGTLDPFAKGCLVIAFGQYTKLFRFFKKNQKTYKATIWLGAQSNSLDIENIFGINSTKLIDLNILRSEINNLKGIHTYVPPKFSAKWINGKRAYDLARSGIEFEQNTLQMQVFETKFISYMHPFITFEARVNEGAYIRSLAQILLDKLKTTGTLSYLERLNEGEFIFENEKNLNPLDYIDLEENFVKLPKSHFENGKKLKIEDFEIQNIGIYFVKFDTHFSIIEITPEKVKYLLNWILLDGN
jgi:tRNA pseudouridine55 synthase